MLRSLLLSLSLSCSFTLAARCQTTDVGLTLDGGLLTVIYGQDCGPVACTPLFGGPVGANQTRVLTHYGAPASLFVVGIGLPGGCVAVPGFDNALLLDPAIVLGIGMTSAPPFVPLPCGQGIAHVTFTLPPGTPSGFAFRLQSLGQSNGGTVAFGPAIECTTV